MNGVVPASPAAVVSPPGFSGELQGHRFLMTGLRTGNTEIYCIDPYNGNAINLTKSPLSHQRYPSWSHDGSRIVFTSDRDGTYNVFTMNSDGSDTRQITRLKAPNLAYFPTWHAESRRILFGLAGTDARICSIAPDGTDLQVVGPGRDPFPSPDGSSIAFTQWVETGYGVFTMRADRTAVVQLTEAKNHIGAVTPTYSPDGSRIVYSDRVDTHLELFVIEVETRRATRLTSFRKFATSPAWSPCGGYISFRLTDEDFWNHPDRIEIAYRERLADKRPVWVMKADGSEPHIIEAMHYQCGIDGSRAVWDPTGRDA